MNTEMLHLALVLGLSISLFNQYRIYALGRRQPIWHLINVAINVASIAAILSSGGATWSVACALIAIASEFARATYAVKWWQRKH